MTAGRWAEIADGVFVRRHEELDLSVGLVLGEQRCLIVDTRGDADQGAELAAAVGDRTPLPWTVALTHAHFDHAHGLSAFLPCGAWADSGCWAALAADGHAGPVSGRSATRCVDVDLGGRRVTLVPLGAAHSSGDLAVHVPDAGVVFAGDLVEHVPGGSFGVESFGIDTTLARWPSALDRLLELEPTTVVPGHGEPVGVDFVMRCREIVAALLGLRTSVGAGHLTRTDAIARSPLPADVTLAALTKPTG